MPSTYELIKGETLASSAASFTFTAIPNTYTDLVIRYSIRGDATYETSNVDSMALRINGSTVAEYSNRAVRGSGSTTSSLSRSTANGDTAARIYGGVNKNSSASDTFSSGEIYVPNYLISQNKPISVDTATEINSSTGNMIAANALLWQNTGAVTSLEVTYVSNASSNFVAGSSFYLYGIKNS
jgi:hypothetical protein